MLMNQKPVLCFELMFEKKIYALSRKTYRIEHSIDTMPNRNKTMKLHL